MYQGGKDEMDTLRFELEYDWEPFKVMGEHLTFAQLGQTPLFPNECNHWGAAVYKWEGTLTRGIHIGKVGMLIDETGNITQRIQKYAAATSESGNLYRARGFLSHGEFRLYILKLHNATFELGERMSLFDSWRIPSPRERRIVYKELLLDYQILKKQPHIVLMF